MLRIILVLAVILAGCGFNPAEGDYGVVEVVPKQDSCWISKRTSPTTHVIVRGLCETKGHDVEVFGHWRY